MLDDLDRAYRRLRPVPRRPPRVVDFDGEIKAAKKDNRVLCGIAELWREQNVPMLDRITSIQYAKGVLTVRLASAADRYNLESLLRIGLLGLTIAKAAGTLTRIKVRS